jgi:quercetin dioxygenase-like cupin family protein
MRPLLLLLTSLAAFPQATSLLTKDLPEFPGKEATMLTITLPPGHASTPHRHHAHVFVYVLEGTVIMQVARGEQKQLGPGETFYENPADIHTVSRNASDTKPAKILVVMFKDKGKPVTEPVNRK